MGYKIWPITNKKVISIIWPTDDTDLEDKDFKKTI